MESIIDWLGRFFKQAGIFLATPIGESRGDESSSAAMGSAFASDGDGAQHLVSGGDAHQQSAFDRFVDFMGSPIGGSGSTSNMFDDHGSQVDHGGFSHSHEIESHSCGSFEPLANIDGTPMCGGIDSNGHTFGSID